MKISEVILEKIGKNIVLDAYVKNAVAKIHSHISSNKMVFFPEYTDHDITHFEAVLETAVDLATDKSRELMSDVDFAVLTTSVMLHDLGMHITKDGFQTLIAPNGPLKPIDGFGDLPWQELWAAFLTEARRFDAQKLEGLFGPKYRPVTKFPGFDEPWTEFDILLVGEFLRRHHPRLAHEIAVQGMPAKDGQVIQFCSTVSDQDKFLSDISGLVARSHGMALRQTFSYLEGKYHHKIAIRSTHPIYLMTLLRIADYFQIQSSRAPSARTDVTKFKSPVSSREWSVHQCVTDITNFTDPEAIDITAAPDNIDTFLRLKDWITDLQRELDLSWAVLGEIYGLQAHSKFNELGIKIRRLRSNIDAVEKFSKTVNYIPEKISFTAAGSDLLKLLVGPLYANNVSVGLRELIQNATDAVKELDNLVEQGLIPKPASRTDISADVQVDFETDAKDEKSFGAHIKRISITDRGVGMTPLILQNYFLKAGASFRSSSAWKKNFEDNNGSSRVQRSGRFGVGALAAFLLGDEISVETRHYSENSDKGLKFSAGIDTSSINVMRGNCEVGTKISIAVPESLQKKLRYLLPVRRQKKVDTGDGIGNYFGRYPELAYTVNSQKLIWDESCLLPARQTQFEDPWNTFETSDFDVNWTYAPDVVDLAVNQIRISGTKTYGAGRAARAGVNIYSDILIEPSLSVGDNSGAFELNLQRNAYAATDLPFGRELLFEITDEFVFECLWQLANSPDIYFPKYSGLSTTNHNEPRWLHCSDGIVLNNAAFLKSYDPTLYICQYGGRPNPNFLKKIFDGATTKSIYAHDRNGEFTVRQFKIKGKLSRVLTGEKIHFVEQTATSHSVLVPKFFVDLIVNQMRPGKDMLRLLENLEKDSVSDWFIQSDGDQLEPAGLRNWRESVDQNGDDVSVYSLHGLSCENNSITSRSGEKSKNDSIIFERWMELLEQPYLPRSATALASLQQKLSNKIGHKYAVFERRNKEAMEKEQEAERATELVSD